MKKKILFLITLLTLISVLSAETKTPLQYMQNPDAAYRIFCTTNDFIYLKLNTQTGCVTAVKLDVDGKILKEKELYKGTTELNKAGTFTLYYTNLPFIYLLVNQNTGDITNISWLEAM